MDLKAQYKNKIVKNLEEIDTGMFKVPVGTKFNVEFYQSDLMISPVDKELSEKLGQAIGSTDGVMFQVDPVNKGSEFYLPLEIVGERDGTIRFVVAPQIIKEIEAGGPTLPQQQLKERVVRACEEGEAMMLDGSDKVLDAAVIKVKDHNWVPLDFYANTEAAANAMENPNQNIRMLK